MINTQNYGQLLAAFLTICLAGCGESEDPRLFFSIALDIDTNQSSVIATPNRLHADGLQDSVIEILVLDSKGFPIQGLEAVITVTGRGNTIEQPVTLLDTNGMTTGRIRSTVAESKTINVTVVDPIVDLQTSLTPTVIHFRP